MLYSFIAGFAVGVAAEGFGAGAAESLFLAMLSAALFAYVRYVGKADARFYAAPLVVAALSLGIGRAAVAPDARGELDRFLDEKIEAVGVVVREPDVRESHARLTVEVGVARAVSSLSSEPVSGRVLVSVERYPEFAYGDLVKATGRLALPEPFTSDSGREFDYPAFLAKDGIGYEMKFAKAELVSTGGGNPAKRALFGLKRKVIESFESVISEPQSNLLAGVLLGVKSSLGEDIAADFKGAGIMHIVVLSGYNIAIVANAAVGALSGHGPRLSLAGGTAAIVLFAVMTGGTASIVRASLMAVLALVARANGRTYLALRALMIVAFVMVAHNPRILLHDPGFQLSFAATLGLILVSPMAERRLRFVTPRWGMRETVATTAATQVFVLPLILYMTGELSLAALPVNILVLPAVPYAMSAGAATAAIGFVSPHLALVPGAAAYALLSYVLFVADFASKVPYASVAVPQLPLSAVALWYAAYGWAIWKLGPVGGEKAKESVARPEWNVSGAYEIVD